MRLNRCLNLAGCKINGLRIISAGRGTSWIAENPRSGRVFEITHRELQARRPGKPIQTLAEATFGPSPAKETTPWGLS